MSVGGATACRADDCAALGFCAERCSGPAQYRVRAPDVCGCVAVRLWLGAGRTMSASGRTRPRLRQRPRSRSQPPLSSRCSSSLVRQLQGAGRRGVLGRRVDCRERGTHSCVQSCQSCFLSTRCNASWMCGDDMAAASPCCSRRAHAAVLGLHAGKVGKNGTSRDKQQRCHCKHFLRRAPRTHFPRTHFAVYFSCRSA